ncbi:YqjF family protein [Halorussus salinus]|uniref:YqjF family protein n=1 Tax=Halorussus salinus TaxID=1364935 RepID=UPI001092B2D8
MGWRHLLFANWPVAPEVVEPHLPDALAVDTYDATAWLSVVPYVNVDVRPRRMPSGFGVTLPELNLRTYVRPEGSRDASNRTAADRKSDGNEAFTDRTPGVYFFSLDADGLPGVGLASVLGARLLHHLPYYRADIDWSVADGEVRFESRRRHPGARPVAFRATYGPTGEEFRPDPDTLAHFLTERYRFYTEAPGGAIRYADIRHDPWTLREASADVGTNTLFRANGFDAPESDPVWYYSRGLDILASPNRELD